MHFRRLFCGITKTSIFGILSSHSNRGRVCRSFHLGSLQSCLVNGSAFDPFAVHIFSTNIEREKSNGNGNGNCLCGKETKEVTIRAINEGGAFDGNTTPQQACDLWTSQKYAQKISLLPSCLFFLYILNS